MVASFPGQNHVIFAQIIGIEWYGIFLLDAVVETALSKSLLLPSTAIMNYAAVCRVHIQIVKE